jgi:hypothetical protein
MKEDVAFHEIGIVIAGIRKVNADVPATAFCIREWMHDALNRLFRIMELRYEIALPRTVNALSMKVDARGDA